MASESVPDGWKEANVVPVYNGGSRNVAMVGKRLMWFRCIKEEVGMWRLTIDRSVLPVSCVRFLRRLLGIRVFSF